MPRVWINPIFMSTRSVAAGRPPRRRDDAGGTIYRTAERIATTRT
jgi:hypothetical protein